MAKYKRVNIGSIVKSKKSGEGDYIKISQDVVLKQGDFLNLEAPKDAILSLTAARDEGKVSGDWVEKRLENLNKIKEFVRFEIVRVSKES